MLFFAHMPPEDSDCFHLLDAHLLKVAAKAEKLANKFNGDRLACYAGLWHDLGKYNREFQEYLKQCDLATKQGENHPVRKFPMLNMVQN